MGKCEMVKNYEFDNNVFTVVNWNGEWCYIDTEVCEYLEYERVAKTMQDHVRDSHKIKVKSKDWEDFKLNNPKLGLLECGRKGLTLVTELGMYELIMKSKKDKAITFQDWVFNTIKALRQDFGLQAWEVISMLSVEDSKAIASEYEDICEDLERNPSYTQLWQGINMSICFYYSIPYTKGTNTSTFRETEYPNIIYDRKKIAKVFLRNFYLTGSHKEARLKTMSKLSKEIDSYIKEVK